MRSLQEELLEILGDKEMNVEELVAALKVRHQNQLTFEIRSALLPLMSSGQVELLANNQIRALRETKTPALAR